jgi:Holliday junction resolvasome RuvABC endonuclease subunit
MIALGLDPGLASFGWGIVERPRHPHGPLVHRRSGTIHTSTTERLEDRLRKIELALTDLLIELPEHALVAVEGISLAHRGGQYVNPDGAIKCGMALGVGVTVFSRWCPRVFANVEWWRAIGAGHGSPKEVRAAIDRILGPLEARTSEHSRDALGLAVAAIGAWRPA